MVLTVILCKKMEDKEPLLSKSKSFEDEEENHVEKTHSFQTFFNIFNANMGTGILAMPYVIRLTGYWGVVMIILIGILGNYTGKILIKCLHENTPEGCFEKRTYADLGEAFWPRYGKQMVHIVNFVEQFSHCILFLIMCGTVMHHTFPDSGISESVWITIISLAVLPVAYVRTMKHISHISLLTVIVAMGSSTCVLVYSLFHHKQWKTHNFSGFTFRHGCIAMGIVTVTYSSNAYLPAIEKSMRYPAEFNAMMNFTYTLVTIIKYNYGILVFFCFGKHTEQIMTLSLPHSPFRVFLSIAVIITALLFYVVPMFTLYHIFENELDIPLLRKLGNEPLKCCKFCTPKLISRFLIIVASIIVAIFVPHFGLLMSFVGGLTGTCLVYVFPCIFHIKLHYKTLPWYNIMLDTLIILIGIVGCACGVAYSAIQIAKEYDFYKMWGIEPDDD